MVKPELSEAKSDVWAHRKLTPMLRQYVDAKAQCPSDCILMFRMGDFFELFFEDARTAARELGITLTARDKGDDPIPMAGVPHHAISGYIAKLVGRGFSVAMCDQVEDPKSAKGIVRREITRLITPGTATDLEALDPGQTAYLGAATVCTADTGRVALALLDLLAGQILCTTLPIDALTDEVDRMGVRELLLDATLHKACAKSLRTQHVAVRVLTEAQQDGDDDDLLHTRTGKTGMQGLQSAKGKSQAAHAHSLHSLHLQSLSHAAACMIRFAESTQRCKLTHLSQPRVYDMARYLVLDETTRRNLELFASSHDHKRHGSLLWHLDRCKTSMGSRQLGAWLLFGLRDLQAIARRADGVGYFKQARSTRHRLQAILGEVYDIERLAGRVAVGRATPRDLGAILKSLTQMPTLQQLLVEEAKAGSAGFVKTWQTLDILTTLQDRLRSALAEDLPLVTNEGGIFRTGYTPELDELIVLCTKSHTFLADLEARERARTQISNLKVRYNRVFGYFLEITRANLHQVPGDYIRKQTLVNAERYITPELKAFEEKVLDADGRRRTLELALWQALLTEVQTHLHKLRRVAKAVGQVDALASLGEVAEMGRYTRPEMVEAPVLDLTQGRHAVLERLMPGGERFVPNDLHLDADGRQLLIVTGPNMAGKSTTMRQAALCVIMAQMGGFVPAQHARIGVCDRIFTRVGAADDLGRGHSTFMVEMVETANILRHATSQSLVLLDEIGRGTSTFDGVSIAWAVAEYLHDVAGCRGMFATHYHELCALADSHARIFNASVAIKQQGERLVFLRHLVDGGASRSFGLEVARLASLPDSVLKRAATILKGLEAERPVQQAPIAASTTPAVGNAEGFVAPALAGEGAISPAAATALAAPKEAAGDQAAQLLLFCRPTQGTPAVPRAASAPGRLERALARLDINGMTPVEAMSALAKLQQML